MKLSIEVKTKGDNLLLYTWIIHLGVWLTLL